MDGGFQIMSPGSPRTTKSRAKTAMEAMHKSFSSLNTSTTGELSSLGETQSSRQVEEMLDLLEESSLDMMEAIDKVEPLNLGASQACCSNKPGGDRSNLSSFEFSEAEFNESAQGGKGIESAFESTPPKKPEHVTFAVMHSPAPSRKAGTGYKHDTSTPASPAQPQLSPLTPSSAPKTKKKVIKVRAAAGESLQPDAMQAAVRKWRNDHGMAEVVAPTASNDSEIEARPSRSRTVVPLDNSIRAKHRSKSRSSSQERVPRRANLASKLEAVMAKKKVSVSSSDSTSQGTSHSKPRTIRRDRSKSRSRRPVLAARARSKSSSRRKSIDAETCGKAEPPGRLEAPGSPAPGTQPKAKFSRRHSHESNDYSAQIEESRSPTAKPGVRMSRRHSNESFEYAPIDQTNDQPPAHSGRPSRRRSNETEPIQPTTNKITNVQADPTLASTLFHVGITADQLAQLRAAGFNITESNFS